MCCADRALLYCFGNKKHKAHNVSIDLDHYKHQAEKKMRECAAQSSKMFDSHQNISLLRTPYSFKKLFLVDTLKERHSR